MIINHKNFGQSLLKILI